MRCSALILMLIFGAVMLFASLLTSRAIAQDSILVANKNSETQQDAVADSAKSTHPKWGYWWSGIALWPIVLVSARLCMKRRGRSKTLELLGTWFLFIGVVLVPLLILAKTCERFAHATDELQRAHLNWQIMFWTVYLALAAFLLIFSIVVPIAGRRRTKQGVAQGTGEAAKQTMAPASAVATGVGPCETTTQPRPSGLAAASIVLGALGYLTFGVTSIPAFIIALAALRQIRRSEGKLEGTDLAFIGLGWSLLTMTLAVMALLLWWIRPG